MHAAVVVVVVIRQVHVILHVSGLRVLAEHRIVVGGARIRHVAQRTTLESGREDVGADEPVRLIDRLALRPLLHHRAEHVRHGLVQRSRLAVIGKLRRELRDAVGQLVRDDVDSVR